MRRRTQSSLEEHIRNHSNKVFVSEPLMVRYHVFFNKSNNVVAIKFESVPKGKLLYFSVPEGISDKPNLRYIE